jgi:hypothetical protein
MRQGASPIGEFIADERFLSPPPPFPPDPRVTNRRPVEEARRAPFTLG